MLSYFMNVCSVASAPERVNSGGVRPKQTARSNVRGEGQGGERGDNRQDRQGGGEERFPSRGGFRGNGGRQRLGSKDNDRVSAGYTL